MVQQGGGGSDEEMGGSPACFLHELGSDGTPTDPQQAGDVARWRKFERERLIPAATGAIVSVYWPIRGEPDLRDWMRAARVRGLRIALPVALALGQPMTFREWLPGSPMAHGLWKIPYPADGAEVRPTTVIAPLVGFDPACYRLGYGGGFFDRTLATLARKPAVIGVGYAGMRITTIFPQSHDIPMDWIVTGVEPSLRRGG